MANLLQYSNFNQERNQKINPIIPGLLKKIKTSSIYHLICKINYALLANKQTSICIGSKYLFKFLNLLKNLALIYNYYQVSKILPKNKNNQLIIIYFKSNFGYNHNFKNLKVISTPSIQVYVSARQLFKLTSRKNNTSVHFILNTSKGLMTHTAALTHNIGGQLLCYIN